MSLIRIRNQKGSLALEQILFIGAVVAMSVGLFAFYGKLTAYFNAVDLTNLPTQPGSPGAATGTNP